ncbi:MAG: FAD-dependent oxidoreductase [bacterium]|nr:FAD-dependent oxidoreductase [bacterium]
MSKIKLKINGKEIKAFSHQTLLEVVEEQKLDMIPTLCHSPELAPYGSCFLCVVEVQGKPNLVPACATRVVEGMDVQTKNDRIIQSRKTALELLLSNHYADCVSPCLINCPAGTDAQGYIALAAMGEYKQALALVRERNPFPAVCGRICVRKCEIGCRRSDIDEPVGVNYIKRFLSDLPGAYDDNPLCEPKTKKTVAVVGSGPAGLTAAWFLGKKGHDVVIYESMPNSGGMLRYGIPEYRLPKAVLDQEIEYITRVGTKILCNTKVGKDISVEELRKKHDALFLAVGAFGGKPMGVDGEHNTEGVVTGVDYLVEKAQNPGPVLGTVLVIGGGNTAMDAARTSWRLGADKVIIAYRRTKNEMPADRLEIEDCLKEGIEIMELVAPVSLKKENNKINALTCIRMKLGEPDASGRRRPVPVEGSEFDLPCSLVVSAIGQNPLLKEILSSSKDKLNTSKWNTLTIDTKTMETNVEGVFAGGDAADDGPTVVVDAIRDGQRAAQSIHNYLSGAALVKEPFYVTKDFWTKPGKQELEKVVESPRHHMNEINVEDRVGNFDEVATGYEFEDMYHEATRCLSCGCVAFDGCKLRLYAEDYDVDMEKYKGYVRKHKVDTRHPHITYDPNKCILCAKCIRTCERLIPISALGLINRGFKTEMRPAMNSALYETSCISCGNCIDVCPTGALQIKHTFPGSAALKQEDDQTSCGFCSIGCSIKVNRISDERYSIKSLDLAHSPLCLYGRFGIELFIQSKRLLSPWIREKSFCKEVSFRDAYGAAAEGLQSAIKKYGADAVGVFIYPELSNEEMYLAAQIAREGLGTNNIGSIALLETGVDSGVLDASFGFTASTTDRSVLKTADLIICNNSDPQSEQAVLSYEIVNAVNQNHAKLICCTSTHNSLESISCLNLDPKRGTASFLWSGITQAIINNTDGDKFEIRKIPGNEVLLKNLEKCSLTETSGFTGVEENKIQEAVVLIQQAKNIVIIHSPDRSRDLSTGDIQTFANLLILLRAQNVGCDLLLPSLAANGAGLELSGADPAFLPGRKAYSGGLKGAQSRKELHERLKQGKIKAALVIGEDPIGYDLTASYFADVEFLVAVDWVQTETVAFADIVMPGSTYLETEGTRCNFEGVVKAYNTAVSPASGIKTWQVLSNLAKCMGLKTPTVFKEITTYLEKAVLKHNGAFASYYWNKGQKREEVRDGHFVLTDIIAKSRPRTPALTAMANYKRAVHEVGIEYYRVGSRR